MPTTKRQRRDSDRNPHPNSNARLKTRIIVAFEFLSPSLRISFPLEWPSRCVPGDPEARKAALGGVRDVWGDLLNGPR
jgi:hypothetical protein